MAKEILSPARVRELFLCDVESGHLYWRETGSGRRKGLPAGSLTSQGYVEVRIGAGKYKAHRLIWAHATGSWPDVLIDHKDGDRANNRLSNLRQATRIENGRNRTANKGNPSGMAGVTWCKTYQKWRVIVALGYFDDLEAAKKVRAKVNPLLFGEFHRSV